MEEPSRFYRWAAGNLLENLNRGLFAEWLVHEALGITQEFRDAWAEHDALYEDIKIEIKAAAYEQAWKQSGPSKIQYKIEQRTADLYVFCLMQGREPTDLDAWTFWVIPTSQLPIQKTISEKPLRKLFDDRGLKGVNYWSLADAIRVAAR